MKILVTGCRGQVGTELVKLAREEGLDTTGLDAMALDITDSTAVDFALNKHRPDAVVNAAAYTAVDRAEEEPEAAFAVNRDGPTNLARTCEMAGIPLVHVSTDYVFNGSKTRGYVEDDSTGPLGVYGASKLAGEQQVKKLSSRLYILRTSWVFSAHGHNFVKTMLRLGREREQLRVVADQEGKPTSAREIARAILAMLESGLDAWGTYHFTQPEATSWHGFAGAIFDEARRQGLPLAIQELREIGTKDYATPAVRPANSALDCCRFERTFGVAIRPWRESLAEVVGVLRDA